MSVAPKPVGASRLGAVARAFDELFVVDPNDDGLIMKRMVVSRAVAAAVGVRWSPKFAAVVYAVAMDRGVRPTTRRKPVYARIRARSLTLPEAYAQSRELNQELRWRSADPPREELRSAVRGLIDE